MKMKRKNTTISILKKIKSIRSGKGLVLRSILNLLLAVVGVINLVIVVLVG